MSAQVYENVAEQKDGSPSADLISRVAFSSTSIYSGDLLQVIVTVHNDSNATLQTQGPDPGFEYDEGETFRSRGFPEIRDSFRVGVDFDGRTGIDHPYRWGLGSPLPPDQTVTIGCAIHLKTARAIKYWAGFVREQVAWVQDQQGSQTISVTNPPAQITNVSFTPSVLRAGGLLHIAISVRNDSSETLPTQGPNSGFAYEEGDTFQSRGFPAITGNFRVAVDFDGRVGVDHPYRWGLGAPLAPGQTATINGTIRVKTAGTARYWAGLVREQIAWVQDQQGAQSITVTPPGSVTISDVAFSPPTVSVGGLLQVSLIVRNDSAETIPTQGPPPGFVYDEWDSFRSREFPEAKGNWRVGVDFDGRVGIDHPFRWGLGAPLAPGEQAMITGAIRLRTMRTVKYWAGLVREQVAWLDDQQGKQTISVNAGTIKIVDASLVPTAISSGQLLNVSVSVRNDSLETLQTQDPAPGFVYDEGDTFRSRGFTETIDSFRIGIDFSGRTSVDHPYRWGLGMPLGPGQTATITGAIRLQTARSIDYWCGLVREQVIWVQDRQGLQRITVLQEPTCSLVAVPTTIEAGDSATLQWTVTDAVTVTLDGDAVPPIGSRTITPQQTTTYALHVAFPDGSSRDLSASVTVTPKKIATLTVSPNSIMLGNPAIVKWYTEAADLVTLDGEVVPASEERVVTPLETTTYDLRVLFADGSSKDLSAVLVVEQSGLAAMLQFEWLPFLRLNAIAGGQSSYDRTMGNRDFSNYLYFDSHGDAVLCDLKGPGTIYRVWVTGFNRNLARIKFYLDGEAAPRVDMLMRDLYAGNNAPFISPIVGDDTASSGGYYCYVPVSFNQGIKITAAGVGGTNFYYNVGYHLYPAGTAVRTWTPAEDNSAVRALWGRVTQDPKSDDGNKTTSGTVNLNIGSSLTIFDADGPRSLSSIKLRVPGVIAHPSSDVWEILNGTWVRIYWDGESNPSVSAPLGSFFGIGQFGTYRAISLAAGLDDANTLYMYFPMPFENHARIKLYNSLGVSLNGITYEIKHKPFPFPFDHVGYFKTQFNDQTHTPNDGTDVTLLDVEGTGHCVGVVLSIRGEANRLFLEGDERIYIDDSQTPEFQGTGTEDFFNGGWYFRGGTFSLPVHGNTADIQDASFERIAMYRLFLGDAIPFNKHLTMGIEHGQTNDVSEEAWALAYYYHKPTARAVLTDALDIGNPASEQSHAYLISNPTWSGERSYSYEGVHHESIGDNGLAHRGYSQFVMAIRPSNAGVLLRRRLDYGIGNQNADVYVDGTRVGTWYRAGSNSQRWRDDNFMVPSWLTKAKERITIRIAYVSSSYDWNEFAYSVFTLVD